MSPTPGGLAGRAESPVRSAGAPLVVRSLAPRPGYAAAVAAEGGGWSVRIREFTLPPVPSTA